MPARTTTRSRPKKRRRPKRASRVRLRALRFDPLDQRQRDLLGLALVALAAFFGSVLYLGWAGGEVGEACADGLVFLFGVVAYLVPVGLLAAGGVLLLGPVGRPARPLKVGAACLFGALLLGLAAESLGLGADEPAREGFFDPAFLRGHGGAAGESLYWASNTLIQDFGTDLLFVFLALTGVLLLTGASVGSIVTAARERVAATGHRLRTTGGGFARGQAALTAEHTPEAPSEPPEVEPVVRATHVEAPALDAAERYPDLFDAQSGTPSPAHPSGHTHPGAGRQAGGGLEAPAGPDNATEPAQPEPAEGDDTDELEAAGVIAASMADDAEPEHPVGPERLTPQGNRRSPVTESEQIDYKLPPAGSIERSAKKAASAGSTEGTMGPPLIEALSHFGVDAKIVGTVTGPHVTRYELRLAPGVKMSKVSNLKDDIAYALAAEEVRILAPIPGHQKVGVEVPNDVRQVVRLGDVLQKPPKDYSPLTVWLGKDIGGQAIGTDLAKQPHILVAGTTGSGKSACVNAMLASILLRATPNEVRMVLVDPKQVELGLYEHIPHLLTPVVTSPRLAANVLQNLIKEMEERYSLMSKARTRNLIELNRVRVKDGERPLPYILCVIDELADLMMVAPGEVEDAVIRLAQKSRAVGIHLLLATQRPSADIITGMIKANVPARIAFAVSSQTDSRVILDQNGAESLLGKGDMLFRPATEGRAKRIQGALIEEEEIERLIEHWKQQGEPELQEELLEAVESEEEQAPDDDFDPDDDDLLGEAISTVVQMGTASTSMLQRRLRVGYTRAGRLIDMMERRGVISGYEGSKARQVLVTEGDLPRILADLSAAPAAAE